MHPCRYLCGLLTHNEMEIDVENKKKAYTKILYNKSAVKNLINNRKSRLIRKNDKIIQKNCYKTTKISISKFFFISKLLIYNLL